MKSFLKSSVLYAAILAACFSPLLTVSAADFSWRSQPIGAQPDTNTEYLPKRDIALRHGRYPLIAYIAGNSSQVKAVQWQNGARVDETVLTSTGQILSVDVEAIDDQASVIYVESISGVGIRLCHSRRGSSSWSAPETILAAGAIFDAQLKLTPAGVPVVAVHFQDPARPEIQKFMVLEQSGTAWQSTVMPVGTNNFAFTIDLSGTKHIVCNPYPTSGGGFLQYITDVTGSWVSQPLPFAGNVNGLSALPGGGLALLGRAVLPGSSYSIDTVTSRFIGGVWSAPEGHPDHASPLDLVVSPSGHLQVLSTTTLSTLGSGGWISQPVPELPAKIIADDEGSLHLLGGLETQLYYHCSSENPWQRVDVTPATGQNYQLEGIVVDKEQRPVVIAYDFEVYSKPAFTRTGASWLRQNLNIPDFYQPDFAIDSLGNLHAFSSPIYTFPTYASGAIPTLTTGVVSTLSLGGTSPRDSLCLDSQNRPHVSFGVYEDSSYSYYYGTRASGSWSVQKIITTDSRGELHSAVVVTPDGTTYVEIPGGLYKKSGTSWQSQFTTAESVYPFEKASFPALAAGPDSTVYGLYLFKGELHAFSGKNGSYTTERIASYVMHAPSLVYTANGPVGVFLSADQRILRTVSKPPGSSSWQMQTVGHIPSGYAFGEHAHIATAADGTLYLAATRKYRLNDSLIRDQLIVYEMAGNSSGGSGEPVITSWKGSGGKFGFRARLQGAAESTPQQLQQSTDLSGWGRVFDLKDAPAAPTGTLQFSGNGFRTDVLLQAEPSVPRAFYRLARGSAILPR